KTRLVDRDDMVSNTISTFISLTAHCARCHDHKLDPIPQSDYYRLQAVFAGVDRGDRPHFKRRPNSSTLAPPEVVYAVVPHAPRPIHLLPRGDVEKPGDLVRPGALACVPYLKAEFTLANPDEEGSRRAAMAEWIADANNVLTW